MFYTEGIKTNPSADTILADSGPITQPMNADLTVMISSTVDAVAVVEYRNAANAGNQFSHAFPVAAKVPLVFNIPHVNPVGAGERVRIRLNAAIVGVCQGSLSIG